MKRTSLFMVNLFFLSLVWGICSPPLMAGPGIHGPGSDEPLRSCCERLMNSKRSIYYLNDWRYRMTFQLRSVYTREETMFFCLGMRNRSHIDYGIDSLWEQGGKARIRLRMIGKMPMPLDVSLQFRDGSKLLAYIPQYLMFGEKPVEDPTIPRKTFEPWKWTSPTYEFEIDHRLTDLKVVEIDASQRMADVDRTNNKLELQW